MTRRTPIAIAGLLLTAALSAACGLTDPPVGTPAPFGGTWTVLRAGGIDATDPVDAPRVQFLVSDTIRVVTPCAEMEAPIEIEEERIAIDAMAVTVRACTADQRLMSDAVLAALRDAVRITGGGLGQRVLINGPGGELILAQPADGPS